MDTTINWIFDWSTIAAFTAVVALAGRYIQRRRALAAAKIRVRARR